MTAGILTCAYDFGFIMWGLIIKPAIKLIRKSRNDGLRRRPCFLKSHTLMSGEKVFKKSRNSV